jgi:8-oxo-dGTP pyrophosphatase MutT (NUDIX family)
MSEPEASVAIVRARLPEPAILLIRRSEREDDSWSGHWSFPGGRRDTGDDSPLETALRELAEECGIELSENDLLDELPLTVARRRMPPFLRVAPFVFEVDRPPAVHLDPKEAVEARWVPLSLLCDPASHILRPVPGMPPNLFYPAVELGPVPLWGFTYRLITEWQELLPADPHAGFEAARRLLDYLLGDGLRLVSGWSSRSAVVEGAIDPARVAAFLSRPGDSVPPVNRVEVAPGGIGILGLAFEEYAIRARGGTRLF